MSLAHEPRSPRHLRAAPAAEGCAPIPVGARWRAARARGEVQPGKPLTLYLILLAVEAETGVVLADLQGRTRRARAVRARQIYFALARRLTGRSTPEIGRRTGGRDHSTVLHGIRRHAADPQRYEPEFSRLMRLLTEGRV